VTPRRLFPVVAATMLATGALASAAQSPKYPPVPKSKLFGRIAYSTPGGDIWVMNANGSCRHQVTHSGSGHDFNPAWAPDGRRLIFRTSRGHYQPDLYGNGLEGLFVVDVDGTNELEIEPPTGGMAADWSPRRDRIAFSGLRAGKKFDTLFLSSAVKARSGRLLERGSSTGRTTATGTGDLDDERRRERPAPADAPATFVRREAAATCRAHGPRTAGESPTATASSADGRSG